MSIQFFCQFGRSHGKIINMNKANIRIIIGIILGVLVGFLANEASNPQFFLGFWQELVVWIQPIGVIFIRLLKMIILPLVFASIVMGVVNLDDMTQLGRLGSRTALYFVGSTAIAGVIGLTVGKLFLPKELPMLVGSAQASMAIKEPESLKNLIIEIVPSNVVNVMSEGLILPVIFFAMFLGVALMSIGQRGKALIGVIDSLNEVVLKMVDWIMKLTPYGVFSLVAVVVAQTGLSGINNLLAYIGVVLLGLTIHLLVALPILLIVFAKKSPLQFFKDMSSALSVAFSTASSMATLPVTLQCLKRNVKVSERISTFVCPIGATVNMDGTALFQVVATVFIANLYGVDLGMSQMVVIIVTTVFASIGAAAVPSAGLVTLAIILNSIGLPLDAIGLILAVDRFLDMYRTMINVATDAVGAAIMNRYDTDDHEQT